jgi:D-glycero-D-manno-heptose 1,7-bisphosphate phosphatase
VTSWEKFEFLPRALEGLALLAADPLAIVIATNQRGIARRVMTAEDLAEIHRRMLAEVEAKGGRIDAIYYCPHEAGCGCRKPEVGMFEAAASDLGLRLSDTAVIGDSPSDMEAAARIGALRVLVAQGDPERPGGEGPEHGVDHLAEDLLEAARWLVGAGS